MAVGYLHDVDVVQEDVLDADPLGAFAEVADHPLGISPPGIIVHVEVGAWKRRRNVCESTLPITRALQLEEQGRIGSEQSGEVVNAAADCHPTVGHGVVCSHLRCGEPPAIPQHLRSVCANQLNLLDAH